MYGRSLRFLFSTGFSSTVNGSKKLKISEAIRVDQAGERAAVRICTYQLFWISPLDPSVQIVKEILSDEIVHERVMDKLAEKHYVKTTALDPLFHLGAFAMASLTSFAGKEAIMCCHAAVEETIARHYNDQLRELETVENAEGLSKNEALEWDEVKHYIKTFRDEELHHQELGERNGASDAPAYPILYNVMSVLPKDVAVALEACNERIRSIEEEKQSALEKMRIDYRLKIESLFGKRQEYLDQIDGFWSSVLASASSPLKDFFNGTIDPKIVRAVTKLHVWTCVKDGSLCRCVSVTFRQNMFVEQGTYSRELNSDLHTISIEPIKWKPGTERARQDSVFRFLSEEMKEKELIEDILDAFDTVFQDPLLVLEEGEE